MDLTLLKLRHKFENFAKGTLKAHVYGAGTDLTTGEVDISFDLDDHVYTVRIRELANRAHSRVD